MHALAKYIVQYDVPNTDEHSKKKDEQWKLKSIRRIQMMMNWNEWKWPQFWDAKHLVWRERERKRDIRAYVIIIIMNSNI